jgi:uncharacterized protein
MRIFNSVACFFLLSLFLIDSAVAQQGQGRGMGPGKGRGLGMGRGAGGHQNEPLQQGHMHDDRHDEDREVFQFLLQNHDKIKRTVKELPNGVETLTESSTPEVAAKIKEHVEWMEHRVENAQPIRMRDPLFAEIFRHTDKITIKREETANGIRVVETSEDAYVVKLIQAHAKVVSGFVERGFAEAMKNHAVPPKSGDSADKAAMPVRANPPVIATHGNVVQLAEAEQQPRDGTKIVVDLTKGSEPNQLNPAIEKLAKYVNIYASGGAKPAKVEIVVVIHGEATLTVLNPDAYSATFKTDINPNLVLLNDLHEAGVTFYVCGQTLISKSAKPEDVAVFVDTAVSALTALANLQADGFAYVPLGN